MANSWPAAGSTERLDQADIAGLHVARTGDELRIQMGCLLLRVLPPDASFAILFAEGGVDRRRVELASGSSCPLEQGELVGVEAWRVAGLQAVPVVYRGHELGELLVDARTTAGLEGQLADVVQHYAVATVNLRIHADALDTVVRHCAALQAFEEGVALFQEENPDLIAARFLGLLTGVLGTQPGALCLLDRPGDPSSALRIRETLGIPDSLLDRIVDRHGRWWPEIALQEPQVVLARSAEGVLPALDNERVPTALTSLISCPLVYHGVRVGVALVFNADTSAVGFAAKLESARRLSELGAALFHRLHLEAASARGAASEHHGALMARIREWMNPSGPPQRPGLDLALATPDASTTCCDYVDLIEAASGELVAVLAQPAGESLDAALTMSSLRSLCRLRGARLEPTELLNELGTALREPGCTGLPVAMTALRLRDSGRQARYGSAGLETTFVYRTVPDTVEKLGTTRGALSGGPPAAGTGTTLRLVPGDVVLLGGASMADAPAAGGGDAFGAGKLHDVLRHAATGRATEIRDAVLAALDCHAGGRPAAGVTMAVIKVIA